MGWRVDPRLTRTGSNLESHCDQTCIVCDVVTYMKLLVFRQVRDRLGRPNRPVYFAHRVGGVGLITEYRVREKINTCPGAWRRLSVLRGGGEKRSKIFICHRGCFLG